tara:strand:+ start:532 stop:696 length:165 start_codon:yes stop_codon:yes gene_type:complete
MKSKNFLWWGDKKYTLEEIKELLENIKQFNAGAIDEYLTNHVDKVFEVWLQSKE